MMDPDRQTAFNLISTSPQTVWSLLPTDFSLGRNIQIHKSSWKPIHPWTTLIMVAKWCVLYQPCGAWWTLVQV